MKLQKEHFKALWLLPVFLLQIPHGKDLSQEGIIDYNVLIVNIYR